MDKPKPKNLSVAARIRTTPKFLPRKGKDVDDFSDLDERYKNKPIVDKRK